MQSENFIDMVNPILQYWQTPFETPPFHLIRTDHFEPAAKEAIKLARKEIKAITENPDSPTFENTVAALDLTGENLGRVATILFNLNSAETSSELQAVARKVSPMLTRSRACRRRLSSTARGRLHFSPCAHYPLKS